MNILLFSPPGGFELVLILLAILLLFGGKKIPELMKGIGKGIREFNSAKANIQSEIEDGMKEEEKKTEQPKSGNSSTEQAGN